MSISWGTGEKESMEVTPNWKRLNKFSDATIPLSGTTVYLSGNTTRCAGPLSYNNLYMVISSVDCHMVATSDPLLSASAYYMFWPAKIPYYHIPQSGSSEYVSVKNHDSSIVEIWVSLVERTD